MKVKTNATNNLQLLSEPRLVWSVSSKQLTSLRQTHWRTACSSVCWCVTWWRTMPQTAGGDGMKDEDFPTCVCERCVSDLHVSMAGNKRMMK